VTSNLSKLGNLGAPTEAAWSYGEARAPHRVRRRHRWLTLPSSTVVFVCLFLPFLRVCGEPTPALAWPMFYSPYVVAALVFGAALAGPRALWGLALALRIVIWATVASWCFVAMVVVSVDPTVDVWSVLSFASAVWLVFAVFARGRPELVIARCGAAAGGASAVWFAGVATSPSGLYGAAISMVAAAVMGLGSAWWCHEARTSP
jgi:hypothetical protein